MFAVCLKDVDKQNMRRLAKHDLAHGNVLKFKIWFDILGYEIQRFLDRNCYQYKVHKLATEGQKIHLISPSTSAEIVQKWTT